MLAIGSAGSVPFHESDHTSGRVADIRMWFVLPAVVCVIAAALTTMISLLVPFWSSIKIRSESSLTANTTGSSSNETPATWLTAELTIGVWGSCLTVQTAQISARGDSDNSTAVSIESSLGSDPQEECSLVAASFTCATFFSTKVNAVSCRRLPGQLGGKCSREDTTAETDLCDADPDPINLLLLLPEREQYEQQQLTGLFSSDNGATLANWEHFRSNACSTGGSLARANTTLAVTSLSLVSASALMLLLGITFAAIESRWVKFGRAIAIASASLETTLLALWIVQSRLLTSKSMDFGTSFYLLLVSVVLLIFSSLASRKHLRLERVARRRMEDEQELLEAQPSGKGGEAKKLAETSKLEVVLDVDKVPLSTTTSPASPVSPVSRRISGKRSKYVAV
jgi:hypothetical protein